MASTRLSLAQQIAQLADAAPVDYDPEDAQVIDAEPADHTDFVADVSGGREHYLEVGPSALRKLHDSIADPKYDGVRTSRRQLLEDDEVASGLDDDDDDEDPQNVRLQAEEDSQDEDRDEDIPSESEEESLEGEHNALMPPPTTGRILQPAPVEDLSTTIRKTREEDRKKGKAISRQLSIWDTLLDARIRIQKAVTAANRLPHPHDIESYKATEDCQLAMNDMLEEALCLSDEILELREKLMTINDSIQPPPRKKRKILTDQDGVTDYEAELYEASRGAAALNKAYNPYMLQTLQKWTSKIQAVAPSVLLPSGRNAFSSKSAQPFKSAAQLIEEALADHPKLLSRTRVRRSKGARIGSAVGDEEDVEIFDDTDFYQQLLRDVIDAKGSDALGGDDWVLNQKQKKAKKKVDTKASKGRKLRFEIHEKMQNFMVPVPMPGSWHEEQIDELFASLLGKGFEGAGATALDGGDMDVDEERDVQAKKRLEEQLREALKGGFRVFG